MFKKSFISMALIAGALSATPALAADYTVRVGYAQPAGSAIDDMAKRFKKLLEKSTQGKVEVKNFPSSQLGKIRDMLEGLRVGTLQMVIDGPAPLSTYTKKAAIFKFPYLMENRAQAQKMWSSPAGKKLVDDIAKESGIRIVALAWRGPRDITANRAIHEPSDMAGLKIRVPPYDIPIQIFKTLGASPTPMDFSEVYLALRQGVVDAQENPLITDWSNHFQEVTKYLILTEHVKAFISAMVGQSYLKSLPPDIRQKVLVAVRTAAKETADSVVKEQEELIAKFRKAGVTVIKPDIPAFRAKFSDFADKHYPSLAPIVKQLKAAAGTE